MCKKLAITVNIYFWCSENNKLDFTYHMIWSVASLLPRTVQGKVFHWHFFALSWKNNKHYMIGLPIAVFFITVL